ncbi:MAG: OB-fold nucleic acid binding domain-containing protein [Methanobacteriaceae archaeon]|uniref:OB-fold nucleic acid binding domain-containing protein n=1 Tax=Methanobrevibacter acididurans TaxID=120963 RepID=UPI0037609019|nr:OB-fold nucleic acid binding domain-containing protein [Methanobacteriaceae archaeon]MDD4594601.1 OB-fold nucleic acid binding domain-containing protein [Methanobacteriaceae archaeon]
MDQEILDEYEKVKDQVSEKEFLEKMESLKKDYENVSFVKDIDVARMVVGTFIDETNDPISDEKHKMYKIRELEPNINELTIIGRVMGISDVKEFTSRKGNDGKLCNLNLADDTGNVRVVLWTDNIKHLKNFKEGDVVQIDNIESKDGYRGLEVHLKPRSTIQVLNSDDFPDFPKYEEPITLIKDIVPNETVNIIGRIIRIPPIRKYNSNGKKGEVTSIEIQDSTGKISYTLWNKDVKLIETLGLNENDTIKILGAQVRERNGEVSLSHWDGRTIKGDFDVPEFEETLFKLGEAHEQKDVTILGIITKIQDTISFQRKDGSDGHVKSIEIADDTGSIRVTLWNDDTNLEFNKGDIIEVIGGNIEYDDYAKSGYRINTNWNTRFVIDPKGYDDLVSTLKESQSKLGPLPIEQVQSFDDDDGEEVDILGRVISLNDSREFQRDDGSVGTVRSADFADSTGSVRVSFWDDKAVNSNLQLGKPFQLENARTKLGISDIELNIGKTARVIELKEDEVKDLPSFAELEEILYEKKKIDELNEDDKNIRVVARILDIQDIHEFQKPDGTPGMVRSIDLADDTGSIKASLWDAKTNLQEFDVGSAVKIENPRVSFRDDRIILSIGNNTNLISPTEEELDNLPTFDELKDIIYQEKTIESLEDDDINVRINGTLKDPYGDKLVLLKCPSCNNTLEKNEDNGYICDYCGEEIEKPRYLLMIPARIVDDTGEISVTFFGELVEELLEMTESEIVQIFENSEDLSVLETKIEDLNGISIEIIADANFDEYNESIRLNPKKILSKSL